MSDFKDSMIEAVERGQTTESGAYAYVMDAYLGAADDLRTRAKEAGYRNPLVAPMFCQTCHWNENAHPREACATGFVPGDPEAYRAHNRRIGWDIG